MELDKAIKHLFPNAILGGDVILRDDGEGAYIDKWNLTDPQPTEAELQQAWEEYQANPPEPPLSEMDALGKQIVDLELENMNLKSQDDVLGQQMASMDIRLMIGGL